MNRQQFIDYLARIVADGFVTEQRAIELLKMYDRGEISQSLLPLPLDEAIVETTEDDVNKAALFLAGLGILSLAGNVLRFRPLSERGQERIATQLQDRFARRVHLLAPKALEKLPLWQKDMLRGIQEHLLHMALLGKLDNLSPSTLRALDGAIRAQQAFLSRFADQQSQRLLDDQAFSREYIGHRSELYNGAARSEFYRQKEEEIPDGFIVEYVAVDDASTCQSCLDAEGFYAPNTGPYPGDVCEGRGFCRCRREESYNPAMLAELKNELRAA